MPHIGAKELVVMLKRFQRRDEYAALKKTSEAAAIEWRWATSLMLPEIPHDDIVRGFKPPKWAKKPPRHGSLHGLDKDGRVRCIRTGERTTPDKTVYEQFLIHEDGGFWCIYFEASPQKAPLGVAWFEMQGERWLRSLHIRHNGTHEYALRWDGDRFAGYTWRVWERPSVSDANVKKVPELRPEKADEMVYSYSYAADGELERVTETRDLGDGEPLVEVHYQRVPKGADLKSLLQEAEDMLVADIPRTVKAAKGRQTVYGLLVQYTGVDTDPGGFAPPLFLPSEGLRERLLREHPKDPNYLWAAAEWESDPGAVRLACQNTGLDEKLHLIFQLTVVQPSPPNYGPVRKMFQRVCARLNALTWKGLLKTTDDFIVVPFDPHGEIDWNADLKACVPVEKLRVLMERGHVGKMKLK
jgi:hypothetical protein